MGHEREKGMGEEGVRGDVAFEMNMQKRVCGSLTIHCRQHLWLGVMV